LQETISASGPAEIRVTKSQIAFKRRIGFAWAWTPDRHLKGEVAPLVLTVGLRRKDPSPRWKQVVEPAPGRFTHYLELYRAEQLDDEVSQWLQEAWELAA